MYIIRFRDAEGFELLAKCMSEQKFASSTVIMMPNELCTSANTAVGAFVVCVCLWVCVCFAVGALKVAKFALSGSRYCSL